MMKRTSILDGHIFSISILPYVVGYYNMESPFPSADFCEIAKEGKAEEWLDLDRAKEAALEILERQKQDSEYIFRIVALHNRKVNIFLEFFRRWERRSLEKLDQETFLSDFHTFLHIYIDEYAIGVITYIYADALSDLLFKKLEEHFGDRASRIIAATTHPEEPSFIFIQRKEMLELMSEIVSVFGRELFEKEPCEIESKIKQSPIYSKLEAHAKKYFWIENNYKRIKILSPVDFLRKMKNESLSFEGPEEELKLMEKRSEEISIRKEQYWKDMDEEEKALVLLLREGAALQDNRKKCVLIANHIIYSTLKDLSRRTSIPFSTLVNATHWELPKILGGKINAKILEERSKDCYTIYCEDKGDHISIGCMKGRKYSFSKGKDIRELRGTPASQGIVRGKVKIIVGEEEFSKLNKGDILVSGMTRPEYVPIMSKSAGIITDEGGLTCHAAIVSRELKIPCIIGTLIGTQVLKDGDEVELDANKGIVKILKRAGVEL